MVFWVVTGSTAECLAGRGTREVSYVLVAR
jgi:hypothetical protein